MRVGLSAASSHISSRLAANNKCRFSLRRENREVLVCAGRGLAVTHSAVIARPPCWGDTARAMSQENVEQLRAGIENFLAGTSGPAREDMLSRSAEGWDPEIELDASETPVLDISGVHRGRDAVKQFWREWLAAWETIRFEYELVDAGDRAVMLLDLRMRGRSSGMEVPLGEHAWVTTFRDGLMIHSKLYMSQSEALEAVGLSEQDAHADS
jgi:SnoaL-like domain